MYQERHGWERPGWFIPDGVAEVSKVTDTGKALPGDLVTLFGRLGKKF